MPSSQYAWCLIYQNYTIAVLKSTWGLLMACSLLTHCAPATPEGDRELGQHWFRSWFIDSTKPLPEQMLTNHLWCLVTFTWGLLYMKCLICFSLVLAENLLIPNYNRLQQWVNRNACRSACARSGLTAGAEAGLIPGLPPTNERRRYFVTTPLIGWAQA